MVHVVEIEVDPFLIMGVRVKKKFYLNLNVYRNAHFHVLDKAKKQFKDELFKKYPELSEIKADYLELSYTVITWNKRKFDTMNVVAVTDKFFCDALIAGGVIPDDDYTRFKYGSIQAMMDTSLKSNKIIINCKFFYKKG
jgi:hypothetical protein